MEIINDLSNTKFDGKCETTFFAHIHCEETSFKLFTLTFEGRVREWCRILPDASIHSFEHLVTKLFRAFDMYDSKRLCKKILKLRKSLDESLHHFHNHFMHFCFEFPK